jgi:hypothetical protein
MGEMYLKRRVASHVICEIQGFQVALTKSDTAGEVTFAGDSQSANQRVERALSGDTG